MPQGKKELFEELFNQHFHQLYVHAYGWIYEKEYAEDIVQDSFCYLWEHFDQYKDQQHYLALLYTFVRSRCSDYLRHQRATENYIEYQLNNPAEENTEDYANYQERLQKVNAIIDQLPLQTRRVFIECVLHRKSYKEAAELLQISPHTVKTLISRAYKSIREKINFILLCLYPI